MRMMRSFLCSLVVTVGLPLAAAGQPSVVPFAEPDDTALAIELVSEPAAYDREATDESTRLEATGRCSTSRLRGIDITLGWEVDREAVEAHRVDLSKFSTGFSTGRFVTSGELAAGDRQIVFQTPEPGIYYYWRLLTKTPDGWVVSGNGRVQAPVCPADGVIE